MSQVIVEKLKVLYEDINLVPNQYHRWILRLYDRGYFSDDQMDPQDVQKILNLYADYL